MKIATDIIKAIHLKSLDEQNTLELIQLCEDIYDRNINVGHDQLVRSMPVSYTHLTLPTNREV